MRESNAGISCQPIVPWLVISCLAILTLCDGCAKKPEPVAARPVPDPTIVEKDALAALETDYKLSYHKKNPEGRIIDMRLEGRQFDDAAIEHVRKCKLLDGLSLNGSSVTDNGMDKLQDLQRLTHIAFVNTGITDRGLSYLENIPTLRDIWLTENNRLTPTGIECLKKAVRGIRIHVMGRPAPKEKLDTKFKDKGNSK